MKTITADILGQSAWLMASRIAGAVFQALTLGMLARAVSPAEFGLFNAILGVLLVISAVAGLGIGPYALRTHSSVGYLPKAAVSLNWIMSVFLLATSALLIFALSVTNQIPTATAVGLLPLALWVGAEKNTEVWSSIAIATGKSHLTALALFLKRAVALGVFSALLLVEWQAFLAYTLALATGALTGNGLLRLTLRRAIIRPLPGVGIRETVRATAPYLWNSVGAHLRNLDVSLVGAVAGPVVGGLYALPARLISPLLLIPQALSPVVLRYSAMGKRDAATATRRVAGTTVVLLLCFGAALALVLPYLIPSLLGVDYEGAVRPAQILCIGIAAAGVVTFLTSILQGRGDATFVGRSSLYVSGLLFVLLAVGALLAGAVGATIGLVLSYTVHAAILYSKFRRS